MYATQTVLDDSCFAVFFTLMDLIANANANAAYAYYFVQFYLTHQKLVGRNIKEMIHVNHYVKRVM